VAVAGTVSFGFEQFEPVSKLGLWPELGRPLLEQFGASPGVLDDSAVAAFTEGGSLALALALHEVLGGDLRLCVFSPVGWPARSASLDRTQHVVLATGARWWDVGGPHRHRDLAPTRRSGWTLDVTLLDLGQLASGLDYRDAPEPEGCHCLNSSAGLILGRGWVHEARSMVPAIIGDHAGAARRQMACESDRRRARLSLRP
jgi:hypothetical protein